MTRPQRGLGPIRSVDVDFNDRVKKGQVLLKLEPTIFNAQVRQAEANIASARASLRLAQATFERNEQLVAQNFLSGLALDQSKREMQVGDIDDTVMIDLVKKLFPVDAKAGYKNRHLYTPVIAILRMASKTVGTPRV